MAGLVAKTVVKKIFLRKADRIIRKEAKQYKDREPFGDADPLFAYYVDVNGKRKKGEKGKDGKRGFKDIPDYIPPDKAEALARARKIAYRLDAGLFSIGSLRFGWSSALGLIPVIGDFAGLILGTIVIVIAARAGVSPWILFLMVLNHLFDFAIGLIPLLGDLAGAYVKANVRNVVLMAKYLDDVYNINKVPIEHGPAVVVRSLEELDAEAKCVEQDQMGEYGPDGRVNHGYVHGIDYYPRVDSPQQRPDTDHGRRYHGPEHPINKYGSYQPPPAGAGGDFTGQVPSKPEPAVQKGGVAGWWKDLWQSNKSGGVAGGPDPLNQAEAGYAGHGMPPGPPPDHRGKRY